MLHTFRFSLQNAVYFIMLPFFGSCIIHILHTGRAKNLNVKLRCQKVNPFKNKIEVKVRLFPMFRMVLFAGSRVAPDCPSDKWSIKNKQRMDQ